MEIELNERVYKTSLLQIMYIDLWKDVYYPFDEVTRRSLQHALAENSIAVDDQAIEGIMKSYNELER